MMMDCHIPWNILSFSAVKITHLRYILFSSVESYVYSVVYIVAYCMLCCINLILPFITDFVWLAGRAFSL